jgi:hypothetical protein
MRFFPTPRTSSTADCLGGVCVHVHVLCFFHVSFFFFLLAIRIYRILTHSLTHLPCPVAGNHAVLLLIGGVLHGEAHVELGGLGEQRDEDGEIALRDLFRCVLRCHWVGGRLNGCVHICTHLFKQTKKNSARTMKPSPSAWQTVPVAGPMRSKDTSPGWTFCFVVVLLGWVWCEGL